MIHGSQLLAAARAAGEVLAIVTAGLKIGDVHLRLDRTNNTAEFIFRCTVLGQRIGFEQRIAFQELCLMHGSGIEGMAMMMLARFDRASRGEGRADRVDTNSPA